MTDVRIYLDVNVVVSTYENRDAGLDHAWWILDAAEGGEFAAVTSELTLAEVLVGPIRDGDEVLAKDYHEVIAPGDALSIAPVDRSTLIEAANLRAMRGSLRLPDAIHMAPARLNESRYLVSDDRRLPFTPGVQLVQLSPYSLDVIRTAKS